MGLKHAVIITTATTLLTTSAYASSGLYARGSIGFNQLTDTDNISSVSGLNIESTFDSGYAIQGAVGYNINERFRVEGELSYRKNDADSLTITNAGALSGLGASADGDVTNFSGFVNGYTNLTGLGPIPSDIPAKPYVMAGLGYSHINADVSTLGVSVVDDNDSVFTYQLGLGLDIPMNEGLSIDLGYRYLESEDLELTDSAGDAFESEYASHSFIVGARLSF